MEATCSSKASVDFQRIARRYNPVARTLHNPPCENLKSYDGQTTDLDFTMTGIWMMIRCGIKEVYLL
jgi:hypothetical protein